MEDRQKIQEALDHIDPCRLNYQEWIEVGMALKAEGMPVAMWDSWSMRDMDRYKPGTCLRHWRSFNGSGVAAGTIFHMAEVYGNYKPVKKYTWDDYLPAEVENYEEIISTNAPEKTKPYQMAVEYLKALFEPDEIVGYVHTALYDEKRDKWIPANKGTWRKRDDIIKDLNRSRKLEDAFGSMNEEAGAWIRINPLDGKDAADKNVTAYRYALAEADSMPIEDQKKLLINMKLPIAALVESGGKSVHAIVKVGAENEQEYKQRVAFLFAKLGEKNFVVDTNNKNPSRLSRLPGAMRKGVCQRLIATNIGCATWEEWIDELNGVEDDLPEIHSARDMFEKPTPEPPVIIDGVLRQGAKMIVTGDSKSGKTCLLTNLGVCIAEGWEWLGHQCKQGKVLYINLEVMQSDFEARYKSIYKAYEEPATEQGKDNFDFWNLRGKAESLEKLAPKIIRRCRGKKYLVIIVDPIYKVQGGDENSAEAIGRFCALFDKIAEETGASMIYVHHHAKGAAGGKKAMDRMSGSGVFARDADAIVDFSNLVIDANTKELIGALTGNMTDDPIPLQMEMILRSFKSPKPMNMFFEFPLHVTDTQNVLEGAAVEGSGEANRMKSPNNQRSDSDKKAIVDACFEHAVRADGTAKFSDMYNSPLCEVTDQTLKRYIFSFPKDYVFDKGTVRRVE